MEELDTMERSSRESWRRRSSVKVGVYARGNVTRGGVGFWSSARGAVAHTSGVKGEEAEVDMEMVERKEETWRRWMAMSATGQRGKSDRVEVEEPRACYQRGVGEEGNTAVGAAVRWRGADRIGDGDAEGLL